MICVWTCDVTSKSYFGKMNSTLGAVVPLAMFVILSPFWKKVLVDCAAQGQSIGWQTTMQTNHTPPLTILQIQRYNSCTKEKKLHSVSFSGLRQRKLIEQLISFFNFVEFLFPLMLERWCPCCQLWWRIICISHQKPGRDFQEFQKGLIYSRFLAFS